MNNIDKHRSSSFRTAFFFLNKKKKKALSVLYKYAREVDDIADSNKPACEKIKELQEFKKRIELIYQNKTNEPEDLLWLIKEFDIPKHCFDELIEGMLYDSGVVNISTLNELEEYMYRVAGVIGICILKISDYKGEDCQEIARYCGYALQLTNIIRDFYDDFKINRIYIPKEHRIKILRTEDIDIKSERIKDLLRFEKEIARQYYRKAERLFNQNKSFSLFISAIMKNIYREILENMNFETERKNHKISNYKKIKAVLKALLEVL
jgi:phytoene synthase